MTDKTNTSRVWLITGAGRGLGRAFAQEAINNGDCVIAGVRRMPENDPLFKNERLLAVKMDVTDKEQVADAVKKGVDQFGRIDILINNAGFGFNGALEEISIEELRRLFETDYFGLVQVTQAVLPVMRGQKSGRILNIASQSGLIAGAGTSAYNAVKFAVVGLTEALDQEMTPFGIEAMVVCPGPFRTDFRDSSSAMRPGNLMPEYDGTPAHDLLNYLDENNHTQSGDPAKAAAVVYKIATAERMPGRLALGSTCTAGYERFLKAQLEELSSYQDLSRATDFD